MSAVSRLYYVLECGGSALGSMLASRESVLVPMQVRNTHLEMTSPVENVNRFSRDICASHESFSVTQAKYLT